MLDPFAAIFNMGVNHKNKNFGGNLSKLQQMFITVSLLPQGHNELILEFYSFDIMGSMCHWAIGTSISPNLQDRKIFFATASSNSDKPTSDQLSFATW